MERRNMFWQWAGFISRILVGLLFVFSGFVKAVDPMGSTFKFTDYFNAYHLGFLEPGALFFAILLSVAELTIGLAMVFSLRVKATTWGSLLFMALFLPLTLVSALTNKVSDCGCFGDAITLSNWGTFWKNVILMVPVLIAFFTRKKHVNPLPALAEWAVVLLFLVFSGGISFMALRHLPLVDFRPYKIGTSIPDGMKIPDGAPQDEYNISAVYRKGELVQEFVYPDFPDSTWTWVETKNVLVKKGYEPPIHGFSISAVDGSNLTEKILAHDGYTFLVIYSDLDKASMIRQKEINDLALFAASQDIPFYGVTASGEEVISAFEKSAESSFTYLQADEILLKTIIRTNPGLVLLKKGTVIGKWSARDIPVLESIKNKELLSFALMEQQKRLVRWISVSGILLLLVFAGAIFAMKRTCSRIQ